MNAVPLSHKAFQVYHLSWFEDESLRKRPIGLEIALDRKTLLVASISYICKIY